ncbi:Hypothetical protein AKI40_1905 [Enterobacter sp. FY-07]|nr:Hypothetical protein AKI40_1905 [Enterobacter sp. FY-07]
MVITFLWSSDKKSIVIAEITLLISSRCGKYLRIALRNKGKFFGLASRIQRFNLQADNK